MALSRVAELGSFIRDQRQKAHMSLRTVANLSGISNPYLSQIERGLRKPSAEILQGIAKALRISSETLYVRAGILEADPTPDVIHAINADEKLSDEQKAALAELYESFLEGSEDEGSEPAADIQSTDAAASEQDQERAASN